MEYYVSYAFSTPQLVFYQLQVSVINSLSTIYWYLLYLFYNTTLVSEVIRPRLQWLLSIFPLIYLPPPEKTKQTKTELYGNRPKQRFKITFWLSLIFVSITDKYFWLIIEKKYIYIIVAVDVFCVSFTDILYSALL